LDGLAWQYAIASVRVGYNPQAWVTTTPRGRTHWIYELFEKKNIPDEALELFAKQGSDDELVEIFYGTIYENSDNLDPGFMASLLATYPAGWLREQEINGKFVDEGGILGDTTWFRNKTVPEAPEVVKRRLRYWDLAATEKKISGRKRNDPDETVGSKLSWVVGEPDEFYIENQVAGFWEWQDIKDRIVSTAERDGPYVPVVVEQEPGAGGKNQVAEVAIYIKDKLGASWKVQGHRPEGDKVMRANAWFAEAALGQFHLVQGNWNEGFLDQLSSFPEGKHDDKIDSVSGARQVIAPFKAWKHISFLHL
jgi:predicted phage terminase large subunit-like protein